MQNYSQSKRASLCEISTSKCSDNLSLSVITDWVTKSTKFVPIGNITSFKWFTYNACDVMEGKEDNVPICSPDFRIGWTSKATLRLEFIQFHARFKIIVRNVSLGFRDTFIISLTADTGFERMVSRQTTSFPSDMLIDLDFSDIHKFLYALPSGSYTNLRFIIEAAVLVDNADAVDVPMHSSHGQTLRLCQDMMSILNEGKYSDITLRAENKELKAHKAILSGRSPVFNRMFARPTKENLDNCVDILDMTYETLQQFMAYLYSGELHLTIESASDLLVASDKYEVKELNQRSSDFLQRSLTVGNCLKILLLADLRNNSELKKSAMDYIYENSKKICEKPGWDAMLNSRPSLSHELLKVFIRK